MEIDQPQRLLHQIEKVLDFELSFLDYWNDKVYDQLLPIPQYIQFLEQLAQKLINQPRYYQLIDYPYISKTFLEKEFLLAVQSLIDFFEHYQQEGALVFKMKAI